MSKQNASVDLLLLLRRKHKKTLEDFIFGLAHCKRSLTIDDICGALRMERHEVFRCLESLRDDKRLIHTVIDGESYFKIHHD